MAEITIFREYSFLLSLYKWRVYANGEKVAKIGKSSTVSFSLPPGECELMVNCPDFPIPYRKKGVHSNLIKIKLEEGKEYLFNLRPHPLFWNWNHYPGINHLFTPVESILLLKQDKHYQQNIEQLESIGKQMHDETKHFKYHPFSVILIVGFGLFAMVSNTFHPELYSSGDGMSWGFLLGMTSLIGLFSGLNKQMLSRGWEYKILLYLSIGILLILPTLSQPFNHWQGILYCFFILIDSFWAFLCFRRWKKRKKGLEGIEQMELAFEERL